MDFLISTARAQTVGAGSGAAWQQLLFFVPLFVLFYFMLIRPQSKRAKEHRDMVAKLAAGDEVVTTGGILGRITDVGETFIAIDIAPNVTIKVQRAQIAQMMPKGTVKSA
jgi:preprotein translocase subunit YajC